MKLQNLLKTPILLLFLIASPLSMNSENPPLKTGSIMSGKPEIKLLTWNIYMLPHCNLVNKNKKRALQIAEKLRNTDYDILLFEEAFDYRARRIIREKLSFQYPFIYGPANETFFSLKTNSGLWVLSKVPLKPLKEIEYKNRFGIDAMARKGAIMFEGKWKNHDFQLLVTHLQADSPDEVRRQQCNEIVKELLEKYSRKNVPLFVCGDFNIEYDDNDNYNYMLHTLNVENGQLDGDLATSFDEIDNTLAKRQNGKKRLIDYFLLRNHKGIIDKIQRKISVIKGMDGNKTVDLSDHYGIEASILFGSVDR